MTRATQLRANLEQVLAEIDDACRAVGRDPGSVTMVAVSKTWPTSDIEALRELGVLDFGENRAEELRAKAAELADPEIRWHFVGQLQSKKAAAVARVAAVVHSVDRASVIGPLARGAAGRGLDALLQVSLAELAPAEDPTGRGGALVADLPELADAVAEQAPLRLAGVMALPPRSADPAVAFGRLMRVAADLRQRHPGATVVSAGMSGDFAAAIAAGATHVRIGSRLFGERGTVG